MYQDYNAYSQNNNDMPLYELGTISYNELQRVISENSFVMSQADLEHFRKYFFAVLGRAPSINELKMLDEIIKIRRDKLSLCRVTQIKAADKNTDDTLCDLYAKAKYLKRGEGVPFSLEELADIAPKYLNSIGCDNFERIIDKNTVSEPPIQPNSVLLLLLPRMDMGYKEYSDKVRMLYSDQRLYGRLGPIKNVNEFGLLSTLSEITAGISGDLSAFASERSGGDLLALSGKYCGRVIACAYGYLADLVSMIASELGLCARYIGRTANTGKIFFRRSSGTELCLDVGFVKELINIKSFVSAELATALSSSYVSYIGQPTLQGAQLLTMSAALSKDPFNTALRLPFLLILSGVARGYARRDIGIGAEYVVPQSSKGNGLALAVSGILGVYRCLLEMCVSSRASVKYAQGEAVLNCSAFLEEKRGNKEIPQSFASAGHGVYFIPVSFLQNGLPDFYAFRAMCAEIEKLNKEEKILSASAVCGDFSVAISSMSRAVGARIFADGITDNNVFGIILESADKLPIEQVGETVIL